MKQCFHQKRFHAAESRTPDAEKGILDFDLPEMTDEDNQKAQILMSMLRRGLKDLADAYPQNVSFSIKERRKQK